MYGFISIPYGILLHLVGHPWFQRLRRIRQTGLAHLVYPGALHTRFHHALGALHLMQQAIDVLRSKGTPISSEEAEAVCIAILLHDIGHGPYSHALEHNIVNAHHEQLSLWFMEALNREFDGQLTLAIDIFSNRYHKPFLHQLVSGQLDMDRMDYLNRDSFFTGVSEGVIGYDRIIKMLAVHDGNLVVEEKGIYSIEKFLIARRLMYWQVYLHKTNVAAEKMLTCLLKRGRNDIPPGGQLGWFYQYQDAVTPDILPRFALLDDSDIDMALKHWSNSEDLVLQYFASGLLHRHLYRLEWRNTPPDTAESEHIRHRARQIMPEAFPDDFLVLQGKESNQAYNESKEPIRILFKNGAVRNMSECSDVPLYTQMITKYYMATPKG